MKNKLKINETFLNDLLTQAWQDIENIKKQIETIEVDSDQSTQLVTILNDFLTNNYIFVGCLENLLSNLGTADEIDSTLIKNNERTELEKNAITNSDFTEYENDALEIAQTETTSNNFEPFEYFVDFDDPLGDPLTDKDIYNN